MDPCVYLDLSSIIIVIMLIATLLFRKQTSGRSNMLFLALCSCVFISGLSDLITVIYGPTLPITEDSLTLRIVCQYIYFLSRNFTPVLYLLYVCSQTGIWHKITGGVVLKILLFVPYLLDVILIFSNPWTHFVFYMNGSMEYTRGPYILVLYAVAFYYLFLGIGILIRYLYLMDKVKGVILFLFLPLNGISVIVQFLFPGWYIELLSTTLLLLIVIIAVQKPEIMVDSVVGTMSNNAFLQDMKQAFKARRAMSVLLVNFTNHAALRNNLGLFSYHFLLKRLSDKTRQISKIMNLHPDIYYLDNSTFAIITDEHRADDLLDLGRMIHAYMREPVRLSHTEIMVNTMVCLLKCPDDVYDYDTFISISRSFQNKIPDPGRVIILSDVTGSRDFMLRNQMDAIISRGIANHKFQMYYQPIWSVKKQRFVSAEALIRLYDDEYGNIPPSLFIPAAEESGAIHKIGDFVLEDVCRFISSPAFKNLELEYIELNLSLSQCIERDLPQKIRQMMEKYGVDPSQINLEITETAADYDPTTTDKNIRELAGYGIRFSLDDYGTGYSNIKRVVSLPLNIVKLDKCLVDEMDSGQMWAVIHNTVRMLQRINMKVLVEGVETERALKAFSEIGCDYIQGYYFSKPLSEGEFIYFISMQSVGSERS